MRALVVRSQDHIAVEDIAEPTATEGEILIEPILSGLCGTDLELIHATIDPAYVRYPLVLGHEWVGALVDDVNGIGPRGTRVVVEGIIPCGQCRECLTHNTNRCTTYDEIGFTRQGGLAERISVPRNLVHALADQVDPLDASLIEPMAVVWRALTRLPLTANQSVLIIGDGTVALLAAHLVRLFTPSSITMLGQRPAQESLAIQAGATAFTTGLNGERFDLVIEAAGAVAAVQTAMGAVQRGGMVILLGLPPHGSTVEFAPDDLVNDDVIVQGSFSYTQEAWKQVVEEVNARRLTPKFLITHQFQLEEFEHAIAALEGGIDLDRPRGKVTICL